MRRVYLTIDKTRKMKKRINKLFPLDFYGDQNGWHFIIRATKASQVFDALWWRAYICVHRKNVNLFKIACETFSYNPDINSEAEHSKDFSARISMLGPIVEVEKLNNTNPFINKNEIPNQ